MIQSLHILRKDVRHLCTELSLYAVLLIVAAVATPMAWNGANFFAGPLHILVPILWLVLIGRLIHDEVLVGDTQFWITRPYKWTSLLSAKLLFVLLCVVVPFALTQWAMILQAGANPLHTIPGQLLGMLRIGLIVWLILTAVASVTPTVPHMFMSILAVGISGAAAIGFLGGSPGPHMSLPFASETFVIVISILLTSILLYQYSSRNTAVSRVALLATALLSVGLFACLVEGQIQAPVNLLVRHHYPLSTNPSLRLVFDPTSVPSQDTGQGEHSIGKLVIARVPITIHGLDPTTELDNQNVSFTIDAPGYHYTSPWRPADLQDDNLMLFLPQKALEVAHGSNVHLHLSEIAQRMLPGTSQTVTAAESFRIPGDGTCHLLSNPSGNNLRCRYPFELASRTMIRTTVAGTSCSNSGPTHPGIETLAARPPVGGPDPTIEITLHLGGAVCPGTPMTFTDYHPAENFRLELDIPSINLNRYFVR
jgi:hypothetical protein